MLTYNVRIQSTLHSSISFKRIVCFSDFTKDAF